MHMWNSRSAKDLDSLFTESVVPLASYLLSTILFSLFREEIAQILSTNSVVQKDLRFSIRVLSSTAWGRPSGQKS